MDKVRITVYNIFLIIFFCEIGSTVLLDDLFTWSSTPFSKCRKLNKSCCPNYGQVRRVTCVLKKNNIPVPSSFCKQLLTSRPETTVQCLSLYQDCVMTLWSSWSTCSSTCSQGTRYRSRQILLKNSPLGTPCGKLSEIQECHNKTAKLCKSDTVPFYKWNSESWTSCLPTGQDQQSNSGACPRGQRTRKVTCFSNHGYNVSDEFCEQETGSSKPRTSEGCKLACDCKVSKWSQWSSCSLSCYEAGQDAPRGIIQRTRTVLRHPRHGGLNCPSLVDTKQCDKRLSVPECPRYVWHNSTWLQCTVNDPSAICGPGYKTRQVTCIRYGDESLTAVDESLCSDVKAISKSACVVECPVDCQLGEWAQWQLCTEKCEQIRQRPLLAEPRHGGKTCPTMTESRVCNSEECFWWHTGTWSPCSMNTANAECGIGSRIRSVYCVSQDDLQVSDERCSSTKRPASSEECTRLCPEDCQVSPWSEWSECSVSCGYQGGHQLRNRRIINSTIGQNCLQHHDLRQTRPCNRFSCPQYLWQVVSWSLCLPFENRTQECGPNNGYQTRDVYCEEYPIKQSLALTDRCADQPKPVSWRSCDLPCPINCKMTGWSKWSKCSTTCGSHSFKYKARRVIHMAMHGGRSCPLRVRDDGTEIRQRKCQNLPTCPSFKWVINRWSHCEPAEENCGHGKQTRNVSCQSDIGRVVAHEICLNHGLGSPKANERACFRSCDGDCPLTDWGSWSPCSQSCGAKAGLRFRQRTFRNQSESKFIQCSNVRDEDLVITEPCGFNKCPRYSWLAGPWTSCVPRAISYSARDLRSCGEGKQTRNLLCQRNDGQLVSDDFCGRRVTERKCSVPCPVDCHVSDWMEGVCSRKCGQGLKTFTRNILTAAENGGRPCPVLNKTELCNERHCTDLYWTVSPWTKCRKTFPQFPCGSGTRKRHVRCSTGRDEDCRDRDPKPATSEECDKPCQGDCVMTKWSKVSDCQCAPGAKYGNTSRTRLVLKHPMRGKHGCGHLREDTPCTCHSYNIHVGNYSSCIPVQGATCVGGLVPGVQSRPVTCLRDDGHPVSITHCSTTQMDSLDRERPCHVMCPVDCNMSQLSSFTSCSNKCGLHGVRTRSQSILGYPNELGRQCPPEHELVQNVSCNGELCHSYTIERGDWSVCRVGPRGCGRGTRTRTIKCRRSDNHEVDLIYCKLNGEPLDTASTLALLKRIDEASMDMHKVEQCGAPCPGDCKLTSWSSWGPCYRNCSDVHVFGHQVRSRSIVQLAQPRRQACPQDLVQTRKCKADSHETCPIFNWKTSDWDHTGQREVTCETPGGIKVTGGCMEWSKPSEFKQCSVPCGQDGNCVDGICQCRTDYEGDGFNCFPKYGCRSNQHCVINDTYCDQKTSTCLCRKGVLLNDTFCSVNGQSPGVTGFQFDTENWQTWLILACVALVVIVVVIILICLVCRRKRRGDAEIDLHQHLNNLPPPKKINNDLSTNLGPAGKYTKNRFSGSHLPSNYDKNLKIYGRLMKVKEVERGDSGNIYVSGSPESDLSDDVFLDDPPVVQLPPLSADLLEEATRQNRNLHCPVVESAATERLPKPILKKTSAYDRSTCSASDDSSSEEEGERGSTLSDKEWEPPKSPTCIEDALAMMPHYSEDLSRRIVANSNEYTSFDV